MLTKTTFRQSPAASGSRGHEAGCGRRGAWSSLRAWATALAGAAILLIVTSLSDLAMASGGVALGSMLASGPVWVGGEPAAAPTTLFAGDVVHTGPSSTAVLNFHSGAAAQVESESELVLSGVQARLGMELRRGRVSLLSPGPEAMRVRLLGAALLLEEQAGRPAMCTIAASPARATITASQGRVELLAARRRWLVAPGRTAELSAGGAPQAQDQVAGMVDKLMPDVLVKRAGDLGEVFLRSNELVYPNDVIRTDEFGRVRINLFGGSAMNLGPDSTLRVISRDPQNLHTQVELRAGHLRAELPRPAPQGSTFEVQTKSAVITATGRFVIAVDPQSTLACLVDGSASVRNAKLAVAGITTLHNGECARVEADRAPGQVVHPEGTIRRETELTNVAGVKLPGRLPLGTALESSAIATEAGAATFSGLTFHFIGESNSSLTSAKTKFNSAANAATAAQTAATSATSVATALCQAMSALGPPPVSPSSPPARCP